MIPPETNLKTADIPSVTAHPRVKLEFLDGLRGLAAFYVLLFHLYDPTGISHNLVRLLSILRFGHYVVGVFSTSRTLTRSVWQIINVIANTIWGALSTAFGVGDIALARLLHHRTCQASIWTSIPICLALLVSGRILFRIWTHGKVPFDPTLFGLLLLVLVVCNSFWSASYITLMSVNRHQQLAVVYTLATVLSLMIGVVLTRLIGLHGSALALLAIDLFMSSYVINRSLALVHDTLPEFIKSVLTPPLRKLPRRGQSTQVTEA